MTQSTASFVADKAWKSAAGFPLFIHGLKGKTPRWAKKVLGNTCYFLRCSEDPSGEQSLALWHVQKDRLLSGVRQRDLDSVQAVPVTPADTPVPLHEVINDFLNWKRELIGTKINRRTFSEYLKTGTTLAAFFGRDRDVKTIGPVDFRALRVALARGKSPTVLANEIVRVRMYFTHADEVGLIPNPVKYGRMLEKPTASEIRKAREAKGEKMFEAGELRRILKRLESEPTLRAMTLLAINCGYGQWDLSSLPRRALDLDGGWATFPRPKTGVRRRAKLWRETVAAVESALALRPSPRDPGDIDIVFLTPRGKRWVRASTSEKQERWGYRTDLIGREFGKILKELEINGGRNVYALRHTFQTIAENCPDLPAVRHVMGHVDGSMSATYRERIDDARLEKVADAVRTWLFAEDEGGEE